MDEIDFSNERFNGVMAAGWIRDLESSDSRIHKEKTIEKALMAARLGSADAQCFLFNCYQAYNPFYTFHVRQVDEVHGHKDRPNPWPKFWALLESLRTRSFTGHVARDAIADCSQLFDDEEWNTVCRRVIIKDLQIGFLAVNKAGEIGAFSLRPGFTYAYRLADGKDVVKEAESLLR